MHVWVCEDKPERSEDYVLAITSAKHTAAPCFDVSSALQAIGRMADADVVTLDSQLPWLADGPRLYDAGLRIGLAVRAHGKGCALLWFSSSGVPPELRYLGAVEVGDFSCLLDRIKEAQSKSTFGRPASPEWIEFAKKELRKIDPKAFPIADPWGPFDTLLGLCQGYLLIAAHSAQQQGEDCRTTNPALHDLQAMAPETQKLVRERSAAQANLIELAVKRDNVGRGWFDPVVQLLRESGASAEQIPLPAEWGPRPQARLQECLKIESHKQRAAPLIAAERLERDVVPRMYDAACASIRELCAKLLSACETEAVEAESAHAWYELVRRAFLGLELLRLVHL